MKRKINKVGNFLQNIWQLASIDRSQLIPDRFNSLQGAMS